ncbi:Sec-independent protein translocase subunit TatB [Pandoraea nosoerga]|uniref:Sec-independent protein translocase protein TatB n=1 Tax=Pandoraea nosoerga TaxID=2508296 RepID=A0A5E4VNR0_9BURK|nr:Sec-independent protein translocase protein TatB [Pandoraea nosoerga]MBN4666774.1 Sec-independent protein translocase subunit TatB [Pandoraea nosoerga]MBN4677854.1 Sec-independent protein translocase subunit TatB [Pandoraea nosoerga]MBN4683029.1 Sec-independent protein translocase subunit TatB [Pandoraea nosoerga]MBN4746111.1 Sec-independent protein translocase subunit TatB [Pandoraea nosoerga]VVE13988.1 preprotein translocase [Pandoraea nosoerga]
MIDLGLSKLMLIGVVALVVIGPERLPKVARTAGALFGRAQRYINDVKAEVSREMELDELRNMRHEFEDAARSAQNTIQKQLHEQEASLNEAWASATGTSTSDGSGSDAATGSDSYLAEPVVTSGYRASARRRNWRVRRAATPVWFKQASATRTRVQSGAARVARHTPAKLRRPIKFF